MPNLAHEAWLPWQLRPYLPHVQLAAAAPFFSGAAHQFGLPGMLAPNLAQLTQQQAGTC